MGWNGLFFSFVWLNRHCWRVTSIGYDFRLLWWLHPPEIRKHLYRGWFGRQKHKSLWYRLPSISILVRLLSLTDDPTVFNNAPGETGKQKIPRSKWMIIDLISIRHRFSGTQLFNQKSTNADFNLFYKKESWPLETPVTRKQTLQKRCMLNKLVLVFHCNGKWSQFWKRSEIAAIIFILIALVVFQNRKKLNTSSWSSSLPSASWRS